MAILTAYDASGGVNVVDVNIRDLASLTWISNGPTSAVGDLRLLGLPNVQYEFNGNGFAYDATGFPIAGTVTRIAEKLNGQLTFDIQNTSIPVPTFTYWVRNNLTSDAINYIFSGDDRLNGSSFADLLPGQAGKDLIYGNGGDDYLIGSVGNDFIDGGAGSDLAAYAAGESDYHIVTFGGTTAVLPESLSSLAASDGTDKLIDVERLGFLNGDFTGAKWTEIPLASSIDEYFSALEYSASYTDLAAALGTNQQAAFEHYVYQGFREGRATSFNGLEYIASYGDLASAFGANIDAGASHYITSGRFEGRTTSFNGLEYIASYSDLMGAFGANDDAGASHYITSGRFEGRTTSFNGLEYIASYGDLIGAFGVNEDSGASHYITSGRFEGRGTSFDGLQYIASYGDLVSAFGGASFRGVGAAEDTGAGHFIANGFGEGRAADTFDAVQYLANYADLQAAFGTDTRAATVHYVTNGYFEGRTDEPG